MASPGSVQSSQTVWSSTSNNQPFLHSQTEELSNYPNCELCSSQCMIHNRQLWKEQNKTQSFRHSHSRSIISSGEFWTFYWTQEDYRTSARLRMRPRAREGAKRALSEDNGSVAASPSIRQTRLQPHNTLTSSYIAFPRHLAQATTPATTITLATTTSKWQLRI